MIFVVKMEQKEEGLAKFANPPSCNYELIVCTA